MLMPKRVKRRKQFRGSMKGKATRGNKITYGEYRYCCYRAGTGLSPIRSRQPVLL